jgi:hypothetical protein
MVVVVVVVEGGLVGHDDSREDALMKRSLLV